MLDSLHEPIDGIATILQWVDKAQIDYVDCYLRIYIAYNAWYRRATGTANDRQAIDTLKKRYIIWDDYRLGYAMVHMRPLLQRLVELTQRDPLSSHNTYWNGEVQAIDDWRSLIEYWYQVRCLLVHGDTVPEVHVMMAYETLNVFMYEIVVRMKSCLRAVKTDNIRELAKQRQHELQGSDKFIQLQQKLYQKYVAMPDIWQVDMQRAPRGA